MKITGPIPPHILKLMPKADRPKGIAGMTTQEVDERNAVRMERELHDQVAALLRIRGIIAGHARMDRKSTFTEGWPDFTFAIAGRACAIECKRPGGELSNVQMDIMLDMLKDGWVYMIAFDIATVRKFLDDMKKAYELA